MSGAGVGTINGVPLNYTAIIDYAFSGVDSLGRVGNGNDIALTLFPEPTGLVLLGLLAAAQFARRRAR